VPALRFGEVAHLLDEAACLRRIVVLHGGLEVFAERDGLTELTPEPAEQADPRRRDRH
jgi:ABC-type Zn uptake system ZnuABC Zn-binding protein ZnuA